MPLFTVCQSIASLHRLTKAKLFEVIYKIKPWEGKLVMEDLIIDSYFNQSYCYFDSGLEVMD